MNNVGSEVFLQTISLVLNFCYISIYIAGGNYINQHKVQGCFFVSHNDLTLMCIENSS